MRAAAAERGRKKSGPSAHAPARTLALCALSSAHTHALPLRRAYPVPCRHGASDFDLQYCDNALQYARSEHIIVISAMSSI